MNGYLLDTNAALLALSEPADLSIGARRAILAGPNMLSTIVYWEVMLKSMKGALRVGDPRVWWADALEQLPPLHWSSDLNISPKSVRFRRFTKIPLIGL